ncbi:MAG: TetR/AcrR family transcriptional regulator [Lachnospiraceae bacterium]|nr:TetR/AcrR family transcriptional regulator [Lachnospiraceae bacterium]
MEQIEERLLEGALDVYRAKGAKFTMDDLAATLSMSKKTIYTIFPDKKTLLLNMVDYTFDCIKQGKEKALKKPHLTVVDRFRAVLSVMPEKFAGLDFTQIYSMKDKYPECYERIEKRLESDWELTIATLREGISSGEFRPVNEVIFQMMYESATERFLNGSELADNGIRYVDALNEMVDILIDGIRVQ